MSRLSAVLLFDLGGVLIESDVFSELKQLMGTDQSEAELIELWIRNPVARKFEVGECSVDEFSRSVVRELGLSMSPRDFLAAFKRWPKGFYHGVESMLADLRKKNTVCWLSNSNEAHWTGSIADHFDYAFSSHLIRKIKPDREAFEHVVTRIGVNPQDVHFFDDALGNVEAARAFGLVAHHTVGYENLRSKLKELGFVTQR